MWNWFLAHWPELLAGLWALERLADIIARLTPTEKDDALVAKLRGLLEKVASLGFKPSDK